MPSGQRPDDGNSSLLNGQVEINNVPLTALQAIRARNQRRWGQVEASAWAAVFLGVVPYLLDDPRFAHTWKRPDLDAQLGVS